MSEKLSPAPMITDDMASPTTRMLAGMYTVSETL